MYKDKQATWRPHRRRNSLLCQHQAPSPGDSQACVPVCFCTVSATSWLLLPGIKTSLDELDAHGPAITPG